jgi:hypothetical protein
MIKAPLNYYSESEPDRSYGGTRGLIHSIKELGIALVGSIEEYCSIPPMPKSLVVQWIYMLLIRFMVGINEE